jgi:hypothetical protein
MVRSALSSMLMCVPRPRLAGGFMRNNWMLSGGLSNRLLLLTLRFAQEKVDQFIHLSYRLVDVDRLA